MDDLKKKFFFIIHPTYYTLHVVYDDSKILYEKKFFQDGLDLTNDLDNLKKFLDENIFRIEKKFNLYINDIYLIIDDENLINIDLSLIKEFQDLSLNSKYIQSGISNIKESVLKSNIDYELVHMIINRFITDDINQKNFFLELKLICHKKEKLLNLKQLLSNYQISIKKILDYNYVASFKTDQMEQESLIASRLINGLNKNEINFLKRRSKNIGFFEKFFKFLS